MMANELKKFSRKELLEMLIEERNASERMQVELEAARTQLNERKIVLEQVGSIAEATVALNGVFKAADEAARQYIESIEYMLESQKERHAEIEAETIARCERIIEEAKGSALVILDRAESESKKKRRAADEYMRAATRSIKELQENMRVRALNAN